MVFSLKKGICKGFGLDYIAVQILLRSVWEDDYHRDKKLHNDVTLTSIKYIHRNFKIHTSKRLGLCRYEHKAIDRGRYLHVVLNKCVK